MKPEKKTNHTNGSKKIRVKTKKINKKANKNFQLKG